LKDAFNAEKQVAPANKTQDENQGPSLEGAEIPEEEKEAKTKKMSEILHQEPESLSDKFKGYNVKFAQKFLKKMYENLLKTEVAEKEKPEVIGSNGEQVVEETYPKTVKRVPPNNTFQEVDPKDPSTWQPAPLYCIEKEGADPREVTLPELINMHNGLDQLNLGGQAGMLGMMGMFNPMLWPMMNPLVATYMSKMVPIFPVTQPPINVPQAGTPQFTEQEIREMYAFTVVGAGVNAKMCEVLEITPKQLFDFREE